MAVTPRLGLSIATNNNEDTNNQVRDPLASCPLFRDSLNAIRHSSRPESMYGVPIISECALTSTGEPLIHGYTKIYTRADGRIERVSNTLDRTLSYQCTIGNQNSHIEDLKRYSSDPGNYKAFSDTFYPLMPKHIIRVHSAHMCFFPTDAPDALPHSHVIMDKVEGIMFNDFIKEPGAFNKQLMACVAQAICILVTIAQHGWIHNDATVGNFMVVPCNEPIVFENVLPLFETTGEGAGVTTGLTDKPITTTFAAGTPRVVLIDYGDSTKISETAIYPLEAQTFARSTIQIIIGMLTRMSELTGSFKAMPAYFRWPVAPEHTADIAALEKNSQDGLLKLLMLFAAGPVVTGGRRRSTKHMATKRITKKRTAKKRSK